MPPRSFRSRALRTVALLLLAGGSAPSLARAQYDEVDSQALGTSGWARGFRTRIPSARRMSEFEVRVNTSGQIMNLRFRHEDFFGGSPGYTAWATDGGGGQVRWYTPRADSVVAVTLDQQAPFTFVQIETALGLQHSYGAPSSGEGTTRIHLAGHEVVGFFGESSGGWSLSLIRRLGLIFRPRNEGVLGMRPSTSAGLLPLSSSLVPAGATVSSIQARLDSLARVSGIRLRARSAVGLDLGWGAWAGQSTGGTVQQMTLPWDDHLIAMRGYYSEPTTSTFWAVEFETELGQIVRFGRDPGGTQVLEFPAEPGAEIAGLYAESGFGIFVTFGCAYRPTTGRSSTLGSSCGASTLALDGAAPPQIGGSLRLLVNSPTGAPFLLLSVPAPPTAFGSCTLQVDPASLPYALPITAPTTVAAIPGEPLLAHFPLHLQLLSLAPGGPLLGAATLSQGLAVSIGAYR